MTASATIFCGADDRGMAAGSRAPEHAQRGPYPAEHGTLMENRPLTNSGPSTGTLSVRAVGVGKTIEERAILQGIDLQIARGDFVALLGANGAGKSTLLKILSTLHPPTHGTLELFGTTVGSGSSAARRKLGLIGHQTMLYHDLSAIENLEFFGKLHGVPRPRERGMELLTMLGLRHRARDAVKEFSRGMAQRVGIARSLMHDPELLLADEPFAGLDAPSTAMLERVLLDLRAAGKTVVLANHDIRQSLRLAEAAGGRVVMLVKGRKVVDCPAGEVSAEELLGRMEGAAPGNKPASRRIGESAKSGSSADSPIRPLADSPPRPRRVAALATLPRQVAALVAKDLRIEGRTRQTMGLVLVLGVLIVTVLGLGVGEMPRELARTFTPPMLWVAYLFAGVLCFEKTMSVERQDGALGGLLLSPLDRGAIFLAKLLSNLILMFGAAAVITAAGLLFFRFDLSAAPGSFVLVIATAMLGFAAVGTLFAALVSSSRLQGGLLAMVTFPVILPLVIASTQQLTASFREGGAVSFWGPDGVTGLGILLAFDAIFLVASWLMFELILEP